MGPINLYNIQYRIIVLLSTLFFNVSFINIESDKISGLYWTPDKDGRMSIYKKNGNFFGKTIMNKNPTLKDVHNPNPSLRDRLILGTDIFYDFSYDEKSKEYINGKIYNPLDGKTYNAIMWLEGENMVLKGYIGLPFFGITKTFEKYKP
jgi:uncharacterized protein (DUF2147 family)